MSVQVHLVKEVHGEGAELTVIPVQFKCILKVGDEKQDLREFWVNGKSISRKDLEKRLEGLNVRRTLLLLLLLLDLV